MSPLQHGAVGQGQRRRRCNREAVETVGFIVADDLTRIIDRSGIGVVTLRIAQADVNPALINEALQIMIGVKVVTNDLFCVVDADGVGAIDTKWIVEIGEGS